MTITQTYYRQYALKALSRYWLKGCESLELLPIVEAQTPVTEPIPPVVVRIKYPDWAEDLSPDEGIPVPEYLVTASAGEPWTKVDWWQVIHWYLNCTAERAFENANGTIHSYAYRLGQWDSALWERAWVNRIALFLRRWASQTAGLNEHDMFGDLPKAEIIVTHDVDAISKTVSIRFKQTAFHVFNGFRSLLKGQWLGAAAKFNKAIQFMFSSVDYWTFDTIAELERKYGVKSYFNLYGAKSKWYESPKKYLLDPGYDVFLPRLVKRMQQFISDGCQVGLHQSFNTWLSATDMAAERQNVERAIGFSVTSCRQHWLRFGLKSTWQAQALAGFTLDTTLGFNDELGFRNGAALRYKPLVDSNLESLPMVLMDSHLYDYHTFTEHQQSKIMSQIIDEIYFVGGQATVVWHTHVLGNDYAWKDGFETLLNIISSKHHDSH